jgi:type II secretory pathway component PulC
MSEKKSERVKIYLIVILSMVLIVVVYFRFFHKKTTHAAVPARYKAQVARLVVPQVQLPDVQTARQPERAAPESKLAVTRDIFKPLKAPPPQKDVQPLKQKPSKPTLSLKLKGTILGGEQPIAVINDQFVHTGDWIAEYQVVRIAKDEVVLSSDAHQMVLQVLKIHDTI